MTATLATTSARANGKHPPINVAAIPDALKTLPQWVNWKYVGRGRKRTKQPVTPTGRPASTTNPATWSAFQPALQAAARIGGLGFVFANGVCGVDLDHCLDDHGTPSPLAAEIVRRLNSYTEVSPSGRGLHVICFGELPDKGLQETRDSIRVELYDAGRFFTVTGAHWPGTPTTVEERGDEITALYAELAEPVNPFAGQVVPASALAGVKPAAAEWIVSDFIERGELGLIASPPGSMKSGLAMHIATRVAAGERCFTRPDGSGGLATQQAGVFWLNSDNSARTHQERLVATLRTGGTFDVPFYTLTTTDFELARPDHVEWLADLIADCGAELLVIDTLSGVLPGIDENSAKEMTTPAANLRSLANAGLTVLVLHHPPKHDANGSRGSSVLEGKVDVRYALSRDGDLVTLKAQKVRGRARPPLVALAAFQTEPVTQALTGVNFFDGRAEAQDRASGEAEQAILDALDGGPLNTRALYRAVKMRRDVVQRALAALLLARTIEVSNGRNRQKLYARVEGA